MPDNFDELSRQNAALTHQLLEWLHSKPRTYADAMEAWRSSCPRHTIWEDALAAGLIDHPGSPAGIVTLTGAGRRALAAHV